MAVVTANAANEPIHETIVILHVPDNARTLWAKNICDWSEKNFKQCTS